MAQLSNQYPTPPNGMVLFYTVTWEAFLDEGILNPDFKVLQSKAWGNVRKASQEEKRASVHSLGWSSSVFTHIMIYFLTISPTLSSPATPYSFELLKHLLFQALLLACNYLLSFSQLNMYKRKVTSSWILERKGPIPQIWTSFNYPM